MYLAAPTLGNIDHIASLTAWYMAGPAIGLGEKAGKEHGADCGTERRTGCQFRSLRRGGTRARWADRVSRARGLGHGAWTSYWTRGDHSLKELLNLGRLRAGLNAPSDRSS